MRGEPSGEEGQLRSLALVTSPSARASNEGNPSSSTGMLSRVSVSTASKLASFSSSIFLGETGKIGHFSQRTLCLFYFFSSVEVEVVGGTLHAAFQREDFYFSQFCAAEELPLFWQSLKTKFSPCASKSSLSLIF